MGLGSLGEGGGEGAEGEAGAGLERVELRVYDISGGYLNLLSTVLNKQVGGCVGGASAPVGDLG
jgi:hypothetical protein